MKDEPPPTDAARDEFLTARQLAAILQVSETTVRRLAHAGRIPVMRLTPRLMRFNLQAVRDALDGHANRSRSTRRHAAAATSPDNGDTNAQLSFEDILSTG